ncbi:MAG: IS1380 family transposase [Terriglobia bacterium]
MVNNGKKHSDKTRAAQGCGAPLPEANKIGASTPFDFAGRNLTPYGGLLPVATMLEKIGFRELVEQTLSVKRRTRVMDGYRFILAIVLGLYVGFSRLNQLRFIARDPLLTGILRVAHLPPQSTLWRFLASLHASVAGQILEVQRQLRERVWAAANVRLTTVTLDTDTTVHTLYGKQFGARKSYNPKNRGKKSYQPMLTFLAETREFVAGQLRNGDRPTGAQIATHLRTVFRLLPAGVIQTFARADAGFYCREAVEAYEQSRCRFIIVARKTGRLLEQLRQADWKASRKTDADEECQFWYQPEGWGRAYRFIALRYLKKPEPRAADEPEQYQLFETAEYLYRVFVTNLGDPIAWAVWFYNQRVGAENLITEANNDVGLAAHPSRRFDVNGNHFQLAMLAYNVNCWLLLFHREAEAQVETLQHTRLATARLRFLFVAAKVWRHAGRTGVSYSDQYEEGGLLQRLMDRLRAIRLSGQEFAPVLKTALV